MADRKSRLELAAYMLSTVLVTWATLAETGYLERHPPRPAFWLGTARAAGRAAHLFGSVALVAERRYYREVQP